MSKNTLFAIAILSFVLGAFFTCLSFYMLAKSGFLHVLFDESVIGSSEKPYYKFREIGSVFVIGIAAIANGRWNLMLIKMQAEELDDTKEETT